MMNSTTPMNAVDHFRSSQLLDVGGGSASFSLCSSTENVVGGGLRSRIFGRRGSCGSRVLPIVSKVAKPQAYAH